MVSLTVAMAVLLTRSLVSATATFSPNCSLPIEPTTFVGSPNTRGTLDILWSGLFTIFICIWTVQHLNVPEQRDGRDPGWQGDAKWAWKGFLTKFKWMLLTLIFPEFLLGKALHDLKTAKKTVVRVRDLKVVNGNPISVEELSTWTLAHGFYADMGGFAFRTSRLQLDDQRCRLQYLTASDLFKLRKYGHIARLPPITEDEIKDKSKGDFIVKATAVLQASWLVIQVIARATRKIPVSQLEVTACAFAACTFITYGIWWSKPQAVTSCTILSLEGSVADAEATLSDCWEKSSSAVDWLWPWVKKYGAPGARRPDVPIRNDMVGDLEHWFGWFDIGLNIGCILLGAVHCGAWNLHFPTRTELLLWRYISIASCALIPVAIGLIFICVSLFPDFFDDYEWLLKYLHFGLIVLYVGCRLYLLFESIYSLFYLPPEAYITTWASNIPHIG